MASRSVNKVILLGHLGKDAETKYTPSGAAKTTFSLATNRRSKDPQTGEWKDETDWHNITVWKADNLANYLQKGKLVYLEGRLQTRSYDDKDGKRQYYTEVICGGADVILLSSGQGGGQDYSQQQQPVSMPRSSRPQQAAPQQAPAEPEFNQGITDDDVPF